MNSSSDPYNTSVHPYINSIIANNTPVNTWMSDWAKANPNKKAGADNIPDSLLKIYNDIALKQTAPSYQQDLASTNTGLGNEVMTTGNEYQNTVDNLNNQLTVDTRNLNENEGENGTWASSARQDRLNSLNNSYNAKYNTAYNSAVNTMNRNMLTGENSLGANLDQNTLNKSTLQQYGINGVQVGAQPTNSYKYNPFGGYGSINTGYKQGAATLGRNYIAGALQNINP